MHTFFSDGHFRNVILLFFAVIVITVNLHAWFSRGPFVPLQNETIHCTGAAAVDFSCLKHHVESVTIAYGQKTSLHDLAQLVASSSFAATNCHQLSHVIGNTVAQSAANITEAFRDGSNLCFAGYYHGVLEEFIGKRGKEYFVSQVNTICEPLHKTGVLNFDYFNCVHGLGHGVMSFTHNALIESLTLCDLLGQPWAQDVCYGGVFMEHVVASERGHYGTMFRDDDLLYPCNALEKKYKEECYMFQSGYAFTRLGGDVESLFQLCETAEEGYRRTCTKSLGSSIAGVSLAKWSRINHLCNFAPSTEQHQDCVTGAARTFVFHYYDLAPARTVCESAPTQYRSVCLTAILERWNSIVDPRVRTDNDPPF